MVGDSWNLCLWCLEVLAFIFGLEVDELMLLSVCEIMKCSAFRGFCRILGFSR